jgi:hypothetical protein
MKKVVVVMMALMLFSVAAQAAVIPDGYIGADPTHNRSHKDVIGEAHEFDITKVEYVCEPNQMVFRVFSRYFDNVGFETTFLGDLFLSTDGWNPYGSAPYKNDLAANGEDWEVVAVLDDRDAMGGVLGIYTVDEANIGMSQAPNNNPSRWVYRAGQEVYYTPGANEQAIAYGSWAIVPGDLAVDTDDYLEFILPYCPVLHGACENLGFHWTMSCGNDVVEGGVPEPASVVLLGAAAVGVAGARLRRRRR